MSLTEIFLYNVFKYHGTKGFVKALLLSFLVALLIFPAYLILMYLTDFSLYYQFITDILFGLLGLAIFFLVYWKIIVKKA